MHTMELRRRFLEYFKKQSHTLVASSSVLPHDDPSLLFTNAGMNQFKDVFLGSSIRDYKRAATSQKCIRVGGKHNDLENVGHTRRHLTFFEMLGNFSFGDYFKKEAIRFAWEVATEVFAFPAERIWPTVFTNDDEAFELWTTYVPASRITRFGEKENFWAMGDTGPCGPCSELLLDRGDAFGNASCPAADPSGERFLEFWNLVFMQYNRQNSESLLSLPNPSIDTGAGLERVAMLQMGVDSVFETDVLRSLIAAVESTSRKTYDATDEGRAAAFRVIADHMRCLSFAIADGVQPSNVDRGYVLRKVLRRAVRYGRQLELDRPFLALLLPSLIDSMGASYPELIAAKERITEILTTEEEAFIRTLRRGGNLLNSIVSSALTTTKEINGADAFKLKDTYGMPIEEILLIAKDCHLAVDLHQYEQLEKEAKERSRSSQKVVKQIAQENLFASFVEQNGPTQFIGYSQNQLKSYGVIKAIVVDGAFIDKLEAGQEAQIFLDRTPFYAEMGGQVGDSGTLEAEHALFCVGDSQTPYKGVVAHIGKLERGTLHVGDGVTALVDGIRRQKIANNHTATHLLHWALHAVLGQHIKQAGSIVDQHRLRFDFSHHKSLSKKELTAIEDLVNEKIRENGSVATYELPYEEAQRCADIKQFFGEKYGNTVRVVDIGTSYSKELCGGTHTSTTGNIGLFVIAKEGSIAAGIRRIEAVTGLEAVLHYRDGLDRLDALASQLKVPVQKIEERTIKLLEENACLTAELQRAKEIRAEQQAASLQSLVEQIGTIPLLAAAVDIAPELLGNCADAALIQLGSGVVVLACNAAGRCQIAARVSDDWISQGISAVELIKAIAPIIEGSGGGKAASAQAGGKAPHRIDEALTALRQNLLQRTA